jgi:hypothetical protein
MPLMRMEPSCITTHINALGLFNGDFQLGRAIVNDENEDIDRAVVAYSKPV